MQSFSRLPNSSLKLNSLTLRFPSLYIPQPRSQLPASELSIWGSREKSRESNTRKETQVLARAFSRPKW